MHRVEADPSNLKKGINKHRDGSPWEGDQLGVNLKKAGQESQRGAVYESICVYLKPAPCIYTGSNLEMLQLLTRRAAISERHSW